VEGAEIKGFRGGSEEVQRRFRGGSERVKSSDLNLEPGLNPF
jgi:hypothetical protein